MKSIVAALVVLSLTTISCTSNESPQTDESPQTNKSEIESKSPPGPGSRIDSSGVDNSITKVTGLSAKASGRTQVNLIWNSVPDATTYWIYRDKYVPAIITGTNYSDKSVRPGTTYTYSIAPVVKGVLGPKSVAATVTTPR